MALQLACREVARLKVQVAVSKNRLLATDQFAWLGLSDIVPPYKEAAFWIRANYYDPWCVRGAGADVIVQAWSTAATKQPADTDWVTELIRRAEQIIALYGDPNCIDYAHLQASVRREQMRLSRADGGAQSPLAQPEI